ncbi:MAG: hybrid sensor histidine kinase/response regulator [Myxococcales bacterium]|nr:hybrid sensor histidine kinase/response regulator [Myxococcales bacterium]
MSLVLHIEDDPRSRRLVEKLLVAAGHEVMETSSGLEGVRMASERRPDLVLVDINIPDLDGYEVTLRLRGIPALENVPVVAITAEGDRQTSLAVGADGYIGKPIDARRFVRTVERYLAGHRDAVDESGEILLRARTQKIVERLEKKVVELSDANRKLQEMASLRREFLRNTSHELATPLTPVVGYLKLLLAGEFGPLEESQRTCLQSVQSSADRLRAVVDTLLDVSAFESGRMEYFPRDYDFLDVARDALTRVGAAAADRGISLELEPAALGMPAAGDADMLLRSMLHLLDNAIKFSAKGGRIAVAVRSYGQGEELHYALLVADDGPGIPASRRELVHEIFYQVDGSVTRAHGGIGLGLAFARHVARAHGGDVRVESPPVLEVAGALLTGTLVCLEVAPHIEPA